MLLLIKDLFAGVNR